MPIVRSLVAFLLALPLVAVDRIDAERTRELLLAEGTVAFDLTAREPERVMHPHALSWSRLTADGTIPGDLPPDLQRVVLLGDAEPAAVREAEREILARLDQQVPIHHYAGDAAAIVTDPAAHALPGTQAGS